MCVCVYVLRVFRVSDHASFMKVPSVLKRDSSHLHPDVWVTFMFYVLVGASIAYCWLESKTVVFHFGQGGPSSQLPLVQCFRLLFQ